MFKKLHESCSLTVSVHGIRKDTSITRIQIRFREIKRKIEWKTPDPAVRIIATNITFSSEQDPPRLQIEEERTAYHDKLQKCAKELRLINALKNAYDRDFGEKYLLIESDCEEGLCLPWESLLIDPVGKDRGTISGFGWQTVRSLLANVVIEEIQPYGIDFVYSEKHKNELSVTKELETVKQHVGQMCPLAVLQSENLAKREMLPFCLHIAGHGDSRSVIGLGIDGLRKIYPKGCIPLVILSSCEGASPYDPKNIAYALVSRGFAESVIAYPYSVRDDFARLATNNLYPLLLESLKKDQDENFKLHTITRSLHIATTKIPPRRVGDFSDGHAITYIHRAIL